MRARRPDIRYRVSQKPAYVGDDTAGLVEQAAAFALRPSESSCAIGYPVIVVVRIREMATGARIRAQMARRTAVTVAAMYATWVRVALRVQNTHACLPTASRRYKNTAATARAIRPSVLTALLLARTANPDIKTASGLAFDRTAKGITVRKPKQPLERNFGTLLGKSLPDFAAF